MSTEALMVMILFIVLLAVVGFLGFSSTGGSDHGVHRR
jgi:hypothetical protein